MLTETQVADAYTADAYATWCKVQHNTQVTAAHAHAHAYAYADADVDIDAVATSALYS